jgi:hypothetical protein
MGMHGPQPVSFGSQVSWIRVLIVSQEDAKLGRQSLLEKEQKELVGLVTSRTQLQHAGQ